MHKKVIKSYCVDLLSSTDESKCKRIIKNRISAKKSRDNKIKILSNLQEEVTNLKNKIDKYEANKIELEYTICSNIIKINNLQENNNELLAQNKILYDITLLSFNGNINAINDLFN
jgi:hypothetical protein